MSGLPGQRVVRMTVAAVILLAFVATACGKSGGTGAGGSSPAGGVQPSATGGSGNATLGAENVSGLGMVLVDSRGFTLYRLTGETTSNIMCTGSCATTWPPLVTSGNPTGGPGATGTVGTVKRPDGITQVTYDDVPLYTFSGDSGPGQSNGQGISGVWFAVTPDGQSAKGGAGGASPTGLGYGGY